MPRYIHINWEGPITLEEALSKQHAGSCGLYQYYGTHPVYRENALLYIGKTVESNIAARLGMHVHHYWSSTPTLIHVGSVVSEERLDDAEWSRQIALAESLLIYTHSPAWNSSNIKSIDYALFDDIHIFNWGNRGQLLPEVSYARWQGTGNLMPSTLHYQSDFNSETSE